MTDLKKTLKHFSFIDGLIYGTALASNLIVFSYISTMPSFGLEGIIISTSIMLFTSAILEIPAGIMADKYGWGKSATLGFTLKLISTLFISLAIFFAFSNKINIVWALFLTGAICDSFAKALISGAYQAGYLQWYKEKHSEEHDETAPPLFVSAFA